MASIPDPLTRRELLHLKQKKSVNHEAISVAYQAKGRWSEAIDFAERATDAAVRQRLLEEIRAQAIKLGDGFLLVRLNALVPLQPTHWEQAAQAAKAQGKPRHALRIARQMGDQAEVLRLELELGLRAPEPPPLPEPAAPDADAAPADEAPAPEGPAVV